MHHASTVLLLSTSLFFLLALSRSGISDLQIPGPLPLTRGTSPINTRRRPLTAASDPIGPRALYFSPAPLHGILDFPTVIGFRKQATPQRGKVTPIDTCLVLGPALDCLLIPYSSFYFWSSTLQSSSCSRSSSFCALHTQTTNMLFFLDVLVCLLRLVDYVLP
jgi:hypothetical protein